MPQPTFRFAPSPNGHLHLGHAYSTLLNQKLASAIGGRLLLRIEDIDTLRCPPELEADIFRDLEWLGIDWERPVRRQSQHFADYEKVLKRLIREGLVYPAFMSRGEIRAFIASSKDSGRNWPHDPDGVPLYPASDRTLSVNARKRRIAQGEPFAWRLDVEAAMARVDKSLSWKEFADESLTTINTVPAEPLRWGDVILARRDIPTSYHLAVVLDDALQGTSHIVRGRDLFLATSVQRLLQELLGLPQPAYFHHPLILGADGRKLSKSFGDTSLAALRDAGMSPEEVQARVGL